MEQDKINELIEAGGAICESCGERMLKSDGCTWPGLYGKGRYYKRIKFGEESFDWETNAATTAAQNWATITIPAVMWRSVRYAAVS